MPRLLSQLYWKNRENTLGKDYEHGYHVRDSGIYNHIINCEVVSYLVDLLDINYNSAKCEKFNSTMKDKKKARQCKSHHFIIQKSAEDNERCPIICSGLKAYIALLSNDALAV